MYVCDYVCIMDVFMYVDDMYVFVYACINVVVRLRMYALMFI